MTDTNFNTAQNVMDFGRSLGNGVNALAHMTAAFVHVVARGNGDATQIARLIDKARAKGDDGAVRAVKFFIGQVWDGAVVVTEKGKPASIRLKNATYLPGKLALLEQAVADKLSIRSTSLKAVMNPKPIEDKSTNPDASTASGPASDPKATPSTTPSEVSTPATLVEPETAVVPQHALTAQEVFAQLLTQMAETEMAMLRDLLDAHLSAEAAKEAAAV